MTIDTIGGTTSTTNGNSGALSGSPIAASNSGTLLSLGVNVSGVPVGKARMCLYSTKTATPTFTGLLVQSGSVSLVTGWNDLPVSRIHIVKGVTYYIIFQFDTSTDVAYYISGAENYIAHTYGTFPDPTGTLSSAGSTFNMRMTYVPSTSFPAAGLSNFF